jgi:hypothetical protein
MKIKDLKLGLSFLLLGLLSVPVVAHAQGTGFTYNGRLNNNGASANGSYDMRFTIYDAGAGNNVIAGPLTISPVDVANGLFTVRIDFGAGVFTGPPRWLNVEVQPTGGGGFVALTPRQEVTSSPYSIQAQTAGSVVNGGVAANQLNTGGVAPVSGQVLSYNGGNLLWTDPGVAAGGVWSVLNNNAYYAAGNVGIGTGNPINRLSIAGGPSWTANLWKGALDLEFGAAIAFRGNAGTNYGIGSASGGLYFFHTAGNPGTTASPSVFDLELSDSGHLLVGGPSSDRAGIPLQVKGNLLVSPGGSGGEFQVGTPGGETGMSIIGANRADVRFDGTTLKLLAGFGPGAMPSDNGLTVDTSGNVGIGKKIDFGSRLAQHLWLWSDPSTTRYFGIGMQNSTLYNRCGGGGADGFVWYKGGIHNDNFHNAGGGQLLMTLDSNGLFVGGPASVCSLTIRGGCDLAEPFPMKEPQIEKGSVVVIDEEHPGQLKLSTRAYDTQVAGIISGANGVNTGLAMLQEGSLDAGENVALTGRVYVQADASHGAISPGDLLTTSDTPGHAMKVTDHNKAQGAILGKAMSPLKSGTGMVLVLVSLQ